MTIPLEDLKDGMAVEYRLSSRDNAAGTDPEWGWWHRGTLVVTRRTTPAPQWYRNMHGRAGEIGAIVVLRIREKGENWVTYCEQDYNETYDEWLAEDYRMQLRRIAEDVQPQENSL